MIREKSNYKSGDIVTYLDNDEMIVTHRIIKCNGDTFIAQGDNNNLEDEEISINNIYGSVIFHSKIIGFFVLYLLKPIVLIYIIYFIFSEILNLIKQGKLCDDKYNSKEEVVDCTNLEKKES